MQKHALFTYIFLSLSFNCIAHNNQIIQKTPLTETPNRKINIQKVMDYNMPHILKRYCKDYNVSEETAKVHEIELKRFLIIAADDDEPLGMLSPEVDNLWHTFLLFTKEYQNFCNEMFNKFIHHEPITEEEIKDKKEENNISS